MKKLLCVLMTLLLLPLAAPAEDVDEVSLFDLLDDDALVLTDWTDGDPEAGPEPVSIYEEDGSVLLTISATGDFTIGGDSRKRTDIFNNELVKQGGDINFTMRNVRDILLSDDLTIVNFEGTLTDSTYVPANKRNNQFLFSAPPAYVSMLADNGVEAAALENNHIMDHGEEAYEDTKRTLREAGIVYSNSTEIGEIEIKGIRIAMMSWLCIDRYETLRTEVPAAIQAAKNSGRYDLVIVSFHWGNEKDYTPTKNQKEMGRLAVDSGADLVLGHHSHRINPIELYNGVYICYSLGNFCFSGNNKPDDMTSYIFQIRFRQRDGLLKCEGFRIIPIRISSRTDYNDFAPTPLTKATTIDSLLSTLRSNGRKLEYAVEEYPLEWK